MLDEVDLADVKVLYGDIFREAQRGKVLEKFVFMDRHYLLSLDGTGYFIQRKCIVTPVYRRLMMLAFLVDQIQQVACRLFQSVLTQEGSRSGLLEHVRALFYALDFDSMKDIYRSLLYDYEVTGLVIRNSS